MSRRYVKPKFKPNHILCLSGRRLPLLSYNIVPDRLLFTGSLFFLLSIFLGLLTETDGQHSNFIFNPKIRHAQYVFRAVLVHPVQVAGVYSTKKGPLPSFHITSKLFFTNILIIRRYIIKETESIKILTLRRLMSYIYIYIYIYHSTVYYQRN